MVDARALVAPCGMEMLMGHTVAMEGLLLASVMDTPPADAAVPNVIGKLAVLPDIMVTLTGNRMPPAAACATIAVAVALPRLSALAVIVTDPAPTPVTGTDTLVLPAPKLTAVGTVATAALLELRLTVSGAEGVADRFSVRFCVAAPLIVRLAGEKLIVVAVTPPVTCTWELAVG